MTLHFYKKLHPIVLILFILASFGLLPATKALASSSAPGTATLLIDNERTNPVDVPQVVQVTPSGKILINRQANNFKNISFIAIKSFNAVINNGSLNALGIGGPSKPNKNSRAGGSTFFQGIYSRENIENTGEIDLQALGGNAYGRGTAGYASAYGVNTQKEITNSGSISIEALGGSQLEANSPPSGSGGAAGNATALGILAYDGSINEASGDIHIIATGGISDSTKGGPGGNAIALGMYSLNSYITNNGSTSSIAQGGSSLASESNGGYAVSYGMVGTGALTNNGFINAAATGGKAEGSGPAAIHGGHARAYGIFDVGQSNIFTGGNSYITVNATGGDVSLEVPASGSSTGTTEAYGILTLRGTVSNAGNMDVMSQSGSIEGGGTIPDALAYGIKVGDDSNDGGPVSNSGNINVTALSGIRSDGATTSNATAYGIYAQLGITNSGNIYAYAKDEDESSSGLVAAYGTLSETLSGSGGSVNALAEAQDGRAEAKAIQTTAGINYSGNAVAYALTKFSDPHDSDPGIPSNPPGVDDTATALGIVASATTGENIFNGATRVVAKGHGATAVGVDSRTSLRYTGDIAIQASGIGITKGTGIEVTTPDPATVTYSGAMNISNIFADNKRLPNEEITYRGIDVSAGTANITASGSITITAGDDSDDPADPPRATNLFDATGISVARGAATSATVVNDATITIDSGRQNKAVTAYGMNIVADAVDIENNGDITVAGYGDLAIAADEVHVYGIRAQGDTVTIRNTGDITVTAEVEVDGTGQVAGICIAEKPGGTADIYSSGLITIAGAVNMNKAYHIYSQVNTVIHEYAVELSNYTPNYEHSIVVSEGKTLEVGAGGTLYIRPGNLNNGFVLDQDYTIPQLGGIENVSGVTGKDLIFPNILSPGPDLTLTTGRSGDNLTARLSYTPVLSISTTMNLSEREILNVGVSELVGLLRRTTMSEEIQKTTNLASKGTEPHAGMVADTPYTQQASIGDSVTDASRMEDETRHRLFVQPYYHYVKYEDNPIDYSADIFGTILGYDYKVGDGRIGVHFGYSRADITYNNFYGKSIEDQDTFIGGLHGMGKVYKNLRLSGSLAGYGAMHDYEGINPLDTAFIETHDYSSYGMVANISAGYILPYKKHIFMPEIGLNYLWQHREAYTVDTASPLATQYDKFDLHNLYGSIGVNWSYGFDFGNGMTLLPHLGAFVRIPLADSDEKLRQEFNAAQTDFSIIGDEILYSVSTGLTLRSGNAAIHLNYTGDFNKETTGHTAWLKFSLSL